MSKICPIMSKPVVEALGCKGGYAHCWEDKCMAWGVIKDVRKNMVHPDESGLAYGCKLIEKS